MKKQSKQAPEKASKFPVRKDRVEKSSKKSSRSNDDDDDDFVSDDVVGGGGNSYFKPESGDNKIRIISKPIVGWLAWDEDEDDDDSRHPVRTAIDDEPDASKYDKNNKPKKFMTVVII